MKFLIKQILFFIPFLSFGCLSDNPTIVISFDGFRWDYLNKYDLPNFKLLENHGVRAEWMKSAFMTKTFPNHWTLATGLYEESHGIIGNYFHVDNRTYNFRTLSSQRKSDYGGEPVWQTVSKTGRESCVHFWPGSDLDGQYPDRWAEFEMFQDFNKRIDQAVEFVKTNCSLSMLYFEEPDYTGHRFGPESTQVRDKLVEIDGHLGRLFAGLNAEGHLKSTNIIVTSDHGMKERKNGENYFSTTQIPYYLLRPNGMLQSSVSLQLWPRSDSAADKIMKILSRHSDQLLSWRRADIPLEYHYQNNKRVAPIVAVTHRDAIIGKTPQKSAWYSKPTGAHGQSNKDPGTGSVMCTVNKKGQHLIGLAACT